MAKQGRRIPPFDRNGNLPPGVFPVGMKDVEELARNAHRRAQLAKAIPGLKNLRDAGVGKLYLAGSWVSAKDKPNDIDCFFPWHAGVDVSKLDPVFLGVGGKRSRVAMKAKYGLDLLVDTPDRTLEAFFQIDKDGHRRGILLLDLETIHDTE